MERRSVIPIAVPSALFFFSAITIIIALVQTVQIPLGKLPQDSARLASTPVAHFAHALSGALFGLIGPLQFGRVLARKYGRLHRIMGRIFVLAGAVLSLSSLSLLWHFPDGATPIVSGARLIFGVMLGAALGLAMIAIRRRDIAQHRNWMIRAYAIGIGATAVSMVFIPIYAITGAPPQGILSDLAFVGSWTACVIFAEWLVRHISRKDIA